MTILDGHIHIEEGPQDRADFVRRMKSVGVTGGVVISTPPPSYTGVGSESSCEERLDQLFFWSESDAELYPFFWIDPLDDDADAQVDLAVERGVAGFKVICSSYPPGHPQALATFQRIATAGKPILFHSGILWDGQPSAIYNQPAQFEALLNVKNLKFALAHISWPWCDELIAVYGKFLNAYACRSDVSVEMFVDVTPGTPPIYREEVLTKLLTVGYDVEHNVIFGTDCRTNEYNASWTAEWIERDRDIYQGLELGEEVVGAIFCENLRRFVGASSDEVTREIPRPAQ